MRLKANVNECDYNCIYLKIREMRPRIAYFRHGRLKNIDQDVIRGFKILKRYIIDIMVNAFFRTLCRLLLISIMTFMSKGIMDYSGDYKTPIQHSGLDYFNWKYSIWVISLLYFVCRISKTDIRSRRLIPELMDYHVITR